MNDKSNICPCKYNFFVDCYEQEQEKCAKCGWNPIVYKARIYKIKHQKEEGSKNE